MFRSERVQRLYPSFVVRSECFLYLSVRAAPSDMGASGSSSSSRDEAAETVIFEDSHHHRPGPLTEAKQRFDRAARRALRQELDEYALAEKKLDGVTKDEAVRHIRFHNRSDRLLQARAEIYAMNELMRKRELEQFEEFVHADWWRSWTSQARDLSALALPDHSPPSLVPDGYNSAPPPYMTYKHDLDVAQRDYERVMGVRGGGLQARVQHERERELALMPPDLCHQLLMDRKIESKERARELQLTREAAHEQARDKTACERRSGGMIQGYGRSGGGAEHAQVPFVAHVPLAAATARDRGDEGEWGPPRERNREAPHLPASMSHRASDSSAASATASCVHPRQLAQAPLPTLEYLYAREKPPPKPWVTALPVQKIRAEHRGGGDQRLRASPTSSRLEFVGAWAVNMWQLAGDWATTHAPSSGRRKRKEPWGGTRLSDLVTQARARKQAAL